MHEAERVNLLERAQALEERIREMEVESQRQVEEAQAIAKRRWVLSVRRHHPTGFHERDAAHSR